MRAGAERAEAALALMRSVGSVSGRARAIDLVQIEGGWSRHTYRLAVADPERPAAGEYIVRVRSAESVLDTDLGQEFRLYQLLADEPVPTPRVHGYEPATETPFGGPFFVMDRVPGDAVNVWRDRDRARLERSWERDRSLAADFVDNLAALHRLPIERFEGAVVARDFRAMVEHWRGIYEWGRLVRDPVVEEAYAWVLDHEPEPVPSRLVHGDYRIGNCLIDGGRISGVLDWELAFIGDHRFDLGYLALDYEAGQFLAPGSALLGAVAERDWFERRYGEATGSEVRRAEVDVFAAVGALMLIAIMGNGIRLFADGRTADVRAAWSRFVFPVLRRDLVRLMGW